MKRSRWPLVGRVWGSADALFVPTLRRGWVDLLIALSGCALLYELIQLSREWVAGTRPAATIDLSAWALPQYTFFSLSRGLAAYALSLSFTLVYAFWAAKDARAERILIPLLDVLQSIPVLGFMPGVVLALVAVFPRSNIGLELAAVLMIFTGQAWNMTFSLYHSLKSVPPEMQETATLYRFNWWERFKRVELPFGTTALAWNSMMSMAGGWFFLMINESFVLGRHDFRLPGLGSYMTVAVEKGDVPAMVRAVCAMVLMIIFLDQVLWRPVVVWAQRFRVEESASADVQKSWFLSFLRRSRMRRRLRLWQARRKRRDTTTPPTPTGAGPAPFGSWIATGSLVALLSLLTLGSWRLFHFLGHVPFVTWLGLLHAGALTLSRVLLSTAVGTLWAVPAGLAIGLSTRLSRALQPVVQVVASFPAPMLFPAAIAVLHFLRVGLGWGSVVLMLLGTQWYILFNVVAGASSVPSDLREAARSFRLTRLQRLAGLYLPATFPYLVTGWVTAAGGAWNASIVSEYVSYKGHVLSTTGLGSAISRSAESADFHALAAAVLLMSSLVVAFNRWVWRPCYELAATRYSLSK